MSLSPLENSPTIFSASPVRSAASATTTADVIKAQALLANAGYYELPEPGMPTGWPGGELNRALTRFQKDNGLDPDGTLLPLGLGGVTENGVGETAQALKLQLFDRLQRHAAPTVAEVDRFYRGRRPGEPEPETNVVLRSADSGSNEPIGMMPVVMSDEPPADYELQPGQQEARGPNLRPSQPPRLLPARPPVMPDPPMAPRPEAAPPQHGPFPQPAPRERIPDEWLSERSIIKRLQEPNPYAPKQDSATTQDDTPQRGRIIIAEDGKELHVPPLGSWADELSPEDRQIASAINDALAEEMALHIGGSRGSKPTQEGVNAALQGCLEALQDVLPEADIKHVAGGNPRGDAAEKARKEEHLWEFDEAGKQVRKGSNRSDWTIVIARNAAAAVRGNTYDTKDGKVTDREANAERGINNKADDDQMVMVEKHGGARTEADIRRDAYERCYDAAQKIRSDWTTKGEFKQPKPDTPAKYEGPANARRAKEIRRMQGKE